MTCSKDGKDGAFATTYLHNTGSDTKNQLSSTEDLSEPLFQADRTKQSIS